MNDPIEVECPDCEGAKYVATGQHWVGYTNGKWVDDFEWCKTCEGEGKLWKERDNADK